MKEKNNNKIKGGRGVGERGVEHRFLGKNDARIS